MNESNKIKDINSNNKIRRIEKRIDFIESKKQTEWGMNEIDKLKKELSKQKRIVKKRNEFLSLTNKEK